MQLLNLKGQIDLRPSYPLQKLVEQGVPIALLLEQRESFALVC